MKTIDLSIQRSDEGKNPILSFLGRLFPEGGQKQSELEAQDHVMIRLERALGNEFTLIREIKLPGLGTPIPMALVGPPGIYVIYASGVKGSFRARGDAWLKLDNSGNMRNIKPNLPHRTRLYTEAIRKFLLQNEIIASEVEPVLMFSETEAFVENIKAPIRMVMADGLDSYAGSLRLMNPILSPEETDAIIRLLSNPEGKLTFTEEIAAEDEEIVPQQVIMPSEEFLAAEETEEMVVAEEQEEEIPEPDFLADAEMRSVFAGEEAEETPIPIPPVIEEAVDDTPRPSISISSLLARTRMKTWQITFLGAMALLDMVFICIALAVVVSTMIR
jgi:hypothetical protein